MQGVANHFYMTCIGIGTFFSCYMSVISGALFRKIECLVSVAVAVQVIIYKSVSMNKTVPPIPQTSRQGQIE